MNSTLDTLLHHFQSSSRGMVLEAGRALSSNDWAGFERAVDRVAAMGVTASISNQLNSSRDSFGAFMTRIESQFDRRAVKFVFGGVLSGVGGCALAEAAGLAAALGVAILTVQLVAVILLVLGLLTALPAVWSLAMERAGEFKLRMTSP